MKVPSEPPANSHPEPAYAGPQSRNWLALVSLLLALMGFAFLCLDGAVLGLSTVNSSVPYLSAPTPPSDSATQQDYDTYDAALHVWENQVTTVLEWVALGSPISSFIAIVAGSDAIRRAKRYAPQGARLAWQGLAENARILGIIGLIFGIIAMGCAIPILGGCLGGC